MKKISKAKKDKALMKEYMDVGKWVLKKYAKTWDLLYQYDQGTLKIYKGLSEDNDNQA